MSEAITCQSGPCLSPGSPVLTCFHDRCPFQVAGRIRETGPGGAVDRAGARDLTGRETQTDALERLRGASAGKELLAKLLADRSAERAWNVPVADAVALDTSAILTADRNEPGRR